jgi:hypothetical protein
MKPLHRIAGVAILLIGVVGWFGTRPSNPAAESKTTTENPGPTAGKESIKTRTKRTHQSTAQDQEQAELSDTNQAQPPADPKDNEPEETFDDPEDILSDQSVWSLTKDGIDGAIREITSDLHSCYQAALAEIPDLEGGLKVAFTVSDVDGIGQVTEIGIKDTRSATALQLVDEPLENCIMDHFETLQFDPPGSGGDTIIQYPFQFSTD